jgi:hypothetical protein
MERAQNAPAIWQACLDTVAKRRPTLQAGHASYAVVREFAQTHDHPNA